MYLNEASLVNLSVFSMTITCTLDILLSWTVKTATIFASKEFLFSSKCLYIEGIIFKRSSISPLFIVLIKKRLSWEKKKKLPDLPAPSPALNTIFRLCFGAKLAWIWSRFSKKLGNVALKSISLWNVTFTSRLITWLSSVAISDEFRLVLADCYKIPYPSALVCLLWISFPLYLLLPFNNKSPL